MQQCLGLGCRSSSLWSFQVLCHPNVFPGLIQSGKNFIFLQYSTVNSIKTLLRLSLNSAKLPIGRVICFSHPGNIKVFSAGHHKRAFQKSMMCFQLHKMTQDTLSRLQFGSLSSHTAYPFPNISGGIGGDAAAGWVMRSISVSEGSEGALTPVRLMARTRKRSSYNWLLWGKLPAISHNQNNQNGGNKFSNKRIQRRKDEEINPHSALQSTSNDILTFLA